MDSGIIEFTINFISKDERHICISPKLLEDIANPPDEYSSPVVGPRPEDCESKQFYKFCTTLNRQEPADIPKELTTMHCFLDFFFRKRDKKELSRDILIDLLEKVNSLSEESKQNFLDSIGCRPVFEEINKFIEDFQKKTKEIKERTNEFIASIEQQSIENEQKLTDLENQFAKNRFTVSNDEKNVKNQISTFIDITDSKDGIDKQNIITEKISYLNELLKETNILSQNGKDDAINLIKEIDLSIFNGEPYSEKIPIVKNSVSSLLDNKKRLQSIITEETTDTRKDVKDEIKREIELLDKIKLELSKKANEIRSKELKELKEKKEAEKLKKQEQDKLEKQELEKQKLEELKKNQELEELKKKQEEETLRQQSIDKLEKTVLQFKFEDKQFMEDFIKNSYNFDYEKYNKDLQNIAQLFHFLIERIKDVSVISMNNNDFKFKEINNFKTEIIKSKDFARRRDVNGMKITEFELNDLDKPINEIYYPNGSIVSSDDEMSLKIGDILIYRSNDNKFFIGIVISNTEKGSTIVTSVFPGNPELYFFLEDNQTNPEFIHDSLKALPMSDNTGKDNRPNIDNTLIFNAYLLKGADIPNYIYINNETRELLDKI